MQRYQDNAIYKNLQSLFRLFLASILIIGSLNYIFNKMIEDLNHQTKNLETKKMIETKIATTLMSMREDISDIFVLKPDSQHKHYFKYKLFEKLSRIKLDLRILKSGAVFKIGNDIQTRRYKPQIFGSQFDNYNNLALSEMDGSIKLFFLALKDFKNKLKIDKNSYIADLNFLLKEMQKHNNNLLQQTNFHINKVNDDIKQKTQQYIAYELLAIIFVIGSLFYLSNIISNQILSNSQKLQDAKKEAQKMAIKAKQASLAKSEFLANMSHEIRTPLNAILGFIDLLKDKESDKEKLKYITTVQSSSNSLLGIINDILDFSKIESGNLQIEKINFNTLEEFETLGDLFRAKASEKAISLTIKIDPNMPSALISDPLRIKQVIANLLSNAIKFTPRNGRVILNISYKNGYLNVSVQDTGIGIPKDKQAQIFQAFSQAESSTTRQYGGTGLGLSISSKLISMLQGELKLQSQPQQGSKFYFSIPVQTGKYIEHNTKQVFDDTTLEGKHILVVEDNKANQMYMSLLLKKFHITFDIANDGVEAVMAFENKKYDLILMDENMPNLNGIEATKKILKIEQEQNLVHTPIIALTANALSGDRKRFIDAGMDEYLTKPVNKVKLLTIFKEFMKQKKELT